MPPASKCVCVCTGRTDSSEPPHYGSGVFVYQSTAPTQPLSPSPAPEITENARAATSAASAVVDYAHSICLLRGLFEITNILLSHFSVSHLNKEDTRGN